MKRANVRKLIKSIRGGDFNITNTETCVYGHILKVTGQRDLGSGHRQGVIAEFLGIDRGEAINLYVGHDKDGNDMMEGTFYEACSRSNHEGQKQTILKYLRQFAG